MTDQTNPKTVRPTSVPDFGAPFIDIIEESNLFASVENANEWFQKHGSSVLRGQSEEVVKNLLAATSEERRSRGLLILTRAVHAQVAWLEMFQTWSSNGRFTQFKKATDAIRDADLSSEEHQMACNSLVAEHQALLEKIEADKVEREEALKVITDLLMEKAFIDSVEDRQLLVDSRPNTEDAMWCVKAFDLVTTGKAEMVRTATLVALAGNLQFHAERFFGTGSSEPAPTAKTPAKKKPESKVKAQQRGHAHAAQKAEDPTRKRGYESA